jgi:hypothetical protein
MGRSKFVMVEDFGAKSAAFSLQPVVRPVEIRNSCTTAKEGEAERKRPLQRVPNRERDWRG